MRIIKLSPDDEEMKTPEDVEKYFLHSLAKKNPEGQFLLTKGRIAKDGITPGELLVFSYNGTLVFFAHAATGRSDHNGTNSSRYPHFFCVEVSSIKRANGRLGEMEQRLSQEGLLDANLVQAQGWPIVRESDGRRERLEIILAEFRGSNTIS